MAKVFDKLEYNKLCLEFLGFERITPIHYRDPVSKSIIDANLETALFEDWNWIIKIIEKIESLDDDYYVVKILTGGFFIHLLNDTKNYIAKQYSGSKKESLVYGIWEFLNWYNENKNK
jgi:hypothetical protein